jgi:hypothetical protein
MGEKEQDAEIGRLHREHNANKTKRVAMESRMERWSRAFKSLGSHLALNADPDYNFGYAQQDIQALEEFDLSMLINFLEEYTHLRKSIAAQAEKLVSCPGHNIIAFDPSDSCETVSKVPANSRRTASGVS